MALHPQLPESSHTILDPAVRWFPADEALRESSMDKLMPPLRQWCEDLNRAQSEVVYDFVFVDQESFEKFKPKTFGALLDGFLSHKEL